MKKEKVFYLDQRIIAQLMLVLVSAFLLIALSYMSIFPSISGWIEKILSNPTGSMLLVFFIIALCVGIFPYERLIVTEDYYIYRTLFTSREYSKKKHYCIGRGVKEEYVSGNGEDSGHTEYWHQLDLVTVDGSVILIFKVNSSQKYYEKMMTYLKLDELKESLKEKNLTKEAPICIELIPEQTIKVEPESPPQIGMIIKDGLIGLLIYGSFFSEILSQRWSVVFFGLGIIVSSQRENVCRVYQPLLHCLVTDDAIRINGKSYQKQEIDLLQLSASEDERRDRTCHFFWITFTRNGSKRTDYYIIDVSI